MKGLTSYMSIINLTSTQLRKAADLQDQIASLQKELVALTGNGATTPTPKATKATKPAKKKRKITPEHIAKIKAAQKIRWAKFHATKAKSGMKKIVVVAVKKKK